MLDAPMVLASEVLTELGSLFMVTDAIATEVTNSMLNDMSEYGKELIHINKHNGLDAINTLIERTYADELSNYLIVRNVSQEAHNKVLNGELTSYEELRDYDYFPSEYVKENTYSYLIQTSGEEETKKYYIDAIYLE